MRAPTNDHGVRIPNGSTNQSGTSPLSSVPYSMFFFTAIARLYAAGLDANLANWYGTFLRVHT